MFLKFSSNSFFEAYISFAALFKLLDKLTISLFKLPVENTTFPPFDSSLAKSSTSKNAIYIDEDNARFTITTITNPTQENIAISKLIEGIKLKTATTTKPEINKK